ncbi:energy-coupling factor ABC transporter substrate-binding protein [Thermoanaerobacterium thermosaccharolyticum]|jgi:cobalt/nickel transport protein|uniref:Cobalt transport protein CbiN n=2 Tax=Thermoanaerobacterium thermosaccharolyticum TaxID=1517 RepID=D9TRI1_THETC|nr:energy-coupling factor ABC transporter substrate-binding protein [Thermoanaerobacterium thermosaccharolyticum]ADL69329.1 Cobalt transport protein CbiN [Thermoanaerobacterium thermosaccharolyticum DSM 571]KAA5805797.1 energy-coupling factor ABC transporter substrate-binding protein [Thermoanaerobacterium thermosaccharolyticum]MCP2240845.1 cobalt/nickel transport protein [Thermoanaerobacterium thermosaccharolyticum]OXT08920.1 cobalt ABC transporter substrate-binding protein CbiN [Thermoanaerob
MRDKKFLMINLILGLLVISLIVFPLVTIKNAEFIGADDRATEAITQVDKNYKPWLKPVWEPPSGEIESLLFACQAAIGAGFLGYYIGLAKGRKNANR